MKNKSPAFQFYAAEFLADKNVICMTTEEVGAYWLLVSICWRESQLPDDLEELSSLVRMNSEKFQTSWDKRIKRCFQKNEDGFWVHPRLEEERKKQQE
ncbi:MAG: DUF1376 domain-containing protein, partial [Deltaproteobacteria bacterium]|nr:DUF1376 domain-containing protein [Deltaproteobacteria bacterium]